MEPCLRKWAGWIFLLLTRRHSRVCIRIYIFCFKKHTHKQKAKETKVEKR